MNMDNVNDAQRQLQELIALIQRLRAPDGCPWDRKQTRQDIGKYLLDECYEVLDALAENDPAHLQEELGDLLFQILFIAEISAESGEFSLSDVLKGIREKMIRRHPHVFGDVTVRSVQDVKDNWREIKKKERGGAAAGGNLFDGIPRSMPALKRALKISEAASRLGFDWPDADAVLEKLQEELNELGEARKRDDAAQIEEEMGDLFFTLVNLGRFLNVDAEKAAGGAADKFVKRWSYIEGKLAAAGQSPSGATPAALDSIWNEAKKKGI